MPLLTELKSVLSIDKSILRCQYQAILGNIAQYQYYCLNLSVCVRWSCFVFSCVAYVPEPENMTLLKTALSLYRKFEQYADAVLIAMQLGDMDIVREIFTSCSDP